MPRRKPGTLLPLETEILGARAVDLRSGRGRLPRVRPRPGHARAARVALADGPRDPLQGARPARGVRPADLPVGGRGDGGGSTAPAAVRAHRPGGHGGRAGPRRRGRRSAVHASPRSRHDAGAHGRAGGALGALLHARPARAGRPAAGRRDRRRPPRPHRPRAGRRDRRPAHRARHRSRMVRGIVADTVPGGAAMRRPRPVRRSVVRVACAVSLILLVPARWRCWSPTGWPGAPPTSPPPPCS